MSYVPQPEHPSRRLSVDDAWLVEWAQDGVCRLERLLALHAAFDRYLEHRDPNGQCGGAEFDHRIDRE